MPASERQFIRRSKFFELKESDGRKEALRMLFGLGQYILSGQAEIGQLKPLANELAAEYREAVTPKKKAIHGLDGRAR